MTLKSIVTSSAFSVLSLIGSLGFAGSSHRVNIEPVRNFVESKLVDKSAGKLKLGAKLNLDRPQAGISALAVKKAVESRNGFGNFNGGKPTIHIAKMGNQKLLVISTMDRVYQGPDKPQLDAQRFVVRTAKNGLVIARGNVTEGRINWTRSHNERSPKTPAERDDSK